MIDEAAIVRRAQDVLHEMRQGRGAPVALVERVLSQDLTSIVAELHYLRRKLAEAQLPTDRIQVHG